MEIPPYKSEETFKDKLLYAIRFCTAIDADIENAVQEDEVHVEERRERVESEHNDDNNHDDEDAARNHNGGLFGDDYWTEDGEDWWSSKMIIF